MEAGGERRGASRGRLRRPLRSTIGRAGFLLATVMVVSMRLWFPAAAETESWPMLQGGPAHQGVASGAATPPLAQSWRATPPGDAGMASVAVVPGLAVGVAATQVVGMDPATGNVLWTLVRAKGPLSTPAIDPSVGSHGVVVFTEGDSARNSALVGLDPATHDRLWSLRLGDVVLGSPTIEAGRVYVGARDTKVYAADAATGALVWKSPTAGVVASTPAVAGGRVFVVSENATDGDVLAALDTATGRSRWSFRQPQAAVRSSSATVADGVVYVGFGDLVVRAFDAGTGKVLWTQLGRGKFSYPTAPAAVGGSVYVMDEVGGVYRLQADTGQRVWDFQFPSDVTWSSPIVADGSVYVGMDDGTLAAIDDRTGHLVWHSTIAGQVGALAPAGDLILAPVATGAGGLVAFGHDPSGVLIDEPSPTEVDIPVALANFAGAFLIMTALLLGLFRSVLRPRSPQAPTLAVPDQIDEEP